MNGRRLIGFMFVAALLMGLLAAVSSAQTIPQFDEAAHETVWPRGSSGAGAPQSDALRPIVRRALSHDVSPPLRSIPPGPPARAKLFETPRFSLPGRERIKGLVRPGEAMDTVVQNWKGTSRMPSPIQSLDGLGSDDNQSVIGFRIMPPDTQGDVGPRHYVQWVNLVFAVWDKSGNLLYGPAAGNTLWSGFGGPCQNTNDGDVITLYDPLADRWLMSQFALPNYPDGPFYECLAVSTSGDPTGSWNRYAFEWENSSGQDVMNDYPKLGVWPDGYYMSANQYTAATSSWAGAGVAVFERDRMLRGQPARMVYFDLGPSDWGGMLPSDLDGSRLPAEGTPNYFVEANADEWDADLSDALLVYEFHVDWANATNSSFTRVATLPTAPFDGDLCGFSQDCVPQPATVQRLDALADRLMHRLQYRNFGSYETLVTNLTVDADGTDHAGVRWFELRNADGAWSIHQQGTYAPDTDHRWMGSIAMDKAGNIALGYSISSLDVYPSIRYVGRVASDPLGTLPQSESELATGSSFQAGGNRWGDYSMMAVDPVDDCTFWYTQEYISAPGEWGNWNTHIGAFRFPSCLGPTGSLEGVVKDANTGAPVIGARVTAEADLTYATSSQPPDGSYRLEVLPPGTYTTTAGAYGYRLQSFSGVSIIADRTTFQDFPLVPAAAYVLSGLVTDAETGWPLYARLDIDGYPGDAVWTNPATGFYSVTLAAGISYTVDVNAWVDGYHAARRELAPLAGNQTESFGLSANLETCVAPGHQFMVIGIQEQFENGDLQPPGWTVVDNIGNGQVWQFDDPAGRDNQTGGSGGFAIIDSDYYGAAGSQDTELRTPSLSFTDQISVWLEFDTDFLTFTGAETADVDVSNDGGASWSNIWRKTGASYRGPIHEVVDISTPAAGQPDVIVRFRYYDASWQWWWQVDNVLVGRNLGCHAQPGGLVFGNVYDDNTHDPLPGARVTNDEGAVARALVTPLDPAVEDAFYILFSPAGTHSLTATMSGGYGPDTETVTMTGGGALHQDFRLPMGWLDYEPDSMDVTLGMWQDATLPLTLHNQGRAALEFEVNEIEVGFVPEGPPGFVQVTIPAAELAYGSDARVTKRHTRFRPELSFPVEQIWRPSGNVEVLLLTPDAAAGGDISLVESTLEAFPDLRVTLWDATMGDPTAAALAAYDVAIVGNDYLWTTAGMTPDAVGDALADYIDAGGKVIDTLFIHDYSGWRLEGRYIAEGYSPFTASTQDMTAVPYDLGRVYDSGHPIMDGVVAIRDRPTTGISHQDVDVAAGATRLADWDDGAVFIAYNDDVVGINQLWYHGSNWTGNVPILMHNSILYLVSDDVDWLAVEPVSGTLGSAAQQLLSVTFDADAPSVMQTGIYYAKLNLQNDTVYGDPTIPVTMTVVAGSVESYLPFVLRDE